MMVILPSNTDILLRILDPATEIHPMIHPISLECPMSHHREKTCVNPCVPLLLPQNSRVLPAALPSQPVVEISPTLALPPPHPTIGFSLPSAPQPANSFARAPYPIKP
ncbi:Os02g0317350 [Oryza sativa Japonica Group]|uniref:Os02g0317350 protein n=1 Tax=Oryza sativa subsp. japonica TaxID=39947 RepID=A0A0P0VI69_ORYSJ|nr:Os02g0317350 [Oryza sativa Japonica Group]